MLHVIPRDLYLPIRAFSPKGGSYLVGIIDSDTPWIKRDTSLMLMPACIIRDPRTKSLESEFIAMLYALAGYIHNKFAPTMSTGLYYADCEKYNEEMITYAKTFIHKIHRYLRFCIGNNRKSVYGEMSHKTKAVSLIVPHKNVYNLCNDQM